jgi:hypothetical protein
LLRLLARPLRQLCEISIHRLLCDRGCNTGFSARHKRKPAHIGSAQIEPGEETADHARSRGQIDPNLRMQLEPRSVKAARQNTDDDAIGTAHRGRIADNRTIRPEVAAPELIRYKGDGVGAGGVIGRVECAAKHRFHVEKREVVG